MLFLESIPGMLHLICRGERVQAGKFDGNTFGAWEGAERFNVPSVCPKLELPFSTMRVNM